MKFDFLTMRRRSTVAGATAKAPHEVMPEGHTARPELVSAQYMQGLEQRLGRKIIFSYVAGAATLGAILAITKMLGIL